MLAATVQKPPAESENGRPARCSVSDVEAIVVKAFSIVLACLLQAGVARQHPIELTLDVLGIPPAPTRPELPSGIGCGCFGVTPGSPDVPSLTVTLVEITPQTFRVGDEIVFELLVQHVGQTPIPIAISRDPDLARSCLRPNGAVRTSFPLYAKAPAQNYLVLARVTVI